VVQRSRWVVLAVLCCALLVAVTVRLVLWFTIWPLAVQDQIASVVSMVVAIIGLPVAVRHSRPRDPGPGAADSRRARDREAMARLRRHLGRQDSLLRLGETSASLALALRVHQALPLPPDEARSRARYLRTAKARSRGRRSPPCDDRGHGHRLNPNLPIFVERTKGQQVREWMRTAAVEGGFLLLVGDSSVGKTRLLYEAARDSLPDIAVLVPVLGDGSLVNALADATFPLPNLLVWLDELQRFLPGPYLDQTPDAVGITAAAVQRLLDAPSPVVIVGTLWPEYAREFRTTEPDPRTGTPQARHLAAADILNDRRLQEITLETFSPAERQEAAVHAANDPRLDEALANRDFNLTETLAGAPLLVRRYEYASPEQTAILHAAVDARRLGFQAPLTADLLAAAARGHHTTIHPDDTWVTPTLAELTRTERGTEPLIEVPAPGYRRILGYTVADYLLQHITRLRRRLPVPAMTWTALVDHTHDPNNAFRLARAAHDRLLYCYAEPLYRRAAPKNRSAANKLADLLVHQGRSDEAIDLLRTLTDTADRAGNKLVDLLVHQGRSDEAIDLLRTRADTGNQFALRRLADLLVHQDRTDEAMELLRARADAGNRTAANQLAGLLAKQGHTAELRARADAGNRSAAVRLAGLLAKQGRANEAIELLRPPADTGNEFAALRLANLLAKQGHADELRTRAGAGDWFAASQLVNLSVQQGRTDEAIELLRPQADAGNRAAAKKLADLLAKQGRVEDLRARADAGDRFATHQLADLLLQQGRADEAIELLRRRLGTAIQLASLLARHGHADEAIELLRPPADAGNRGAANKLADLLTEHGHGAEIRILILAGVVPGHRLTSYLAPDSSSRLLRYGLTPDGSLADAPYTNTSSPEKFRNDREKLPVVNSLDWKIYRSLTQPLYLLWPADWGMHTQPRPERGAASDHGGRAHAAGRRPVLRCCSSRPRRRRITTRNPPPAYWALPSRPPHIRSNVRLCRIWLGLAVLGGRSRRGRSSWCIRR
jgi:predicted negative regulator of RcsB-dependent stress response